MLSMVWFTFSAQLDRSWRGLDREEAKEGLKSSLFQALGMEEEAVRTKHKDVYLSTEVIRYQMYKY